MIDIFPPPKVFHWEQLAVFAHTCARTGFSSVFLNGQIHKEGLFILLNCSIALLFSDWIISGTVSFVWMALSADVRPLVHHWSVRLQSVSELRNTLGVHPLEIKRHRRIWILFLDPEPYPLDVLVHHLRGSQDPGYRRCACAHFAQPCLAMDAIGCLARQWDSLHDGLLS